MKFRFSKRSKAQETFRVASIMGKYDLTAADVVEKFEGEIPFETIENWQIGVIFGGSGTGKTQIAKQLFPAEYISQFSYSAFCVIEDMPEAKSSDDIAKAFNAVGFTTAKSWLKPYSVLSNGEKMRVDLARAILDNRDLVVFDEFTSVVDRKVAKVGSYAVQKSVRRTPKKQFIAVTCHNDIIEWLEPDWVFCTDDMTFTKTRGSLRRPQIKVDIHEVKGYWDMFSKYHYMNYSILAGSNQFVAFIDNEPVAFCAITHLVHNTIFDGKRMHRLVVLPDYQGIGIGSVLCDFVAKKYHEQGFKVFGRTSHPAAIRTLEKNSCWRLHSNVSRSPSHGCKGHLNNSGSNRRLTTGWQYVGDKPRKELAK